MTKEEKIKEAYGEYWESVKLLTDKNGFICQSTLFFPETEMMDKMEIQVKPFPPDGRCYWRPMVLKGIENNNGWIKIESEEDLPERGYYEVIERATGKPLRASLNNEFGTLILVHYYSHYQPIIDIDLPLY